MTKAMKYGFVPPVANRMMALQW